GLDHLAALGAAGDVRLIGHDDRQEAGVVELAHGFGYPREQLERLERLRGVRPAVADYGAVQHAVAIEEDRSRPGPRAGRAPAHRTDSHFVGRAFSRGCETSRCQTTAWNASAWGVMCSGLTVGTITQASETLAV